MEIGEVVGVRGTLFIGLSSYIALLMAWAALGSQSHSVWVVDECRGRWLALGCFFVVIPPISWSYFTATFLHNKLHCTRFLSFFFGVLGTVFACIAVGGVMGSALLSASRTEIDLFLLGVLYAVPFASLLKLINLQIRRRVRQ
ncbi:MAG: hypothetical protein HY706_16520 [Candidatus Hydrogenedentes bacterium]|nr:hypothetical protein [Candidatus Hydrogenedentota bacterium]